MADQPLFAGHALRRLRRRSNLTQLAMANRLSISPSYLNLIERNQRPLSARVMMQLVSQFDFDPRSLRADESVGGIDGLARRLSDDRFADLPIDREDINELFSYAPQFAAAFARLYDNSNPAKPNSDDPLSLSRQAIERRQNYFADLDEAAEKLADELRLSRGDFGVALTERLRERHQLSVRILPRDVLPDWSRRLDLHARQVQLSEMLDVPARNFQLAMQLAQLELRQRIDDIVSGENFDDTSGSKLFERYLYSYAAAALLMPYSRFLRACRQTNYDLLILPHRFGVSFEQLAHRMTTLQRVGERGLPFFMARLDNAGQMSKKFIGASGTNILASDQTCPLWHVHRSFARPSDLQLQLVTYSDHKTGVWLTASKSVGKNNADGRSAFAIVIGVKAEFAAEWAQSRGMALGESDAQIIGPGCRKCFKANCLQRSLPPENAKLQFEPGSSASTPFQFD